MPVITAPDRVRLEDECIIDEAEVLHAWLLAHPDVEVDLSACTHLHAALLQVLLAHEPRVILPAEGALSDLLARHFSSPPNRRSNQQSLDR